MGPDHSYILEGGATDRYSRGLAACAKYASGVHARTDANAVDMAGRQDGQQKGSHDSAATAMAIRVTPKLTQVTGHAGYVCSLKMGIKVLKGEVLLWVARAAEPGTHDIGYDSGQKVLVYTEINPGERQEATAYNNWLILAQRTSDAPCKIYRWISIGVDASIRKMIVTRAGDGRQLSRLSRRCLINLAACYRDARSLASLVAISTLVRDLMH